MYTTLYLVHVYTTLQSFLVTVRCYYMLFIILTDTEWYTSTESYG